MDRLAIAAVIVVVAVAVALLVRRRRPDPPTQPPASVPTQLDRDDFTRPEAPWLVVVFTSTTCHTCADVAAKAAVLASGDVAVAEVEYSAARDIHRRYRIDSVPLVLVVDHAGIVKRSVLGPVTATDLWAAVAAARADRPEV